MNWIIEEISYSSKRLWLYHDDLLNPFLVKSLDALSIWNGMDKNDLGLSSWEFPSIIPDEIINLVIARLK